MVWNEKHLDHVICFEFSKSVLIWKFEGFVHFSFTFCCCFGFSWLCSLQGILVPWSGIKPTLSAVKIDSLEKTLMLGKIEGRRRRGQQRMRWLDGITDLMDMSLNKLWSWWWTGKPGVLQSMGLQRVGHNWVTELTFFLEEILKFTR